MKIISQQDSPLLGRTDIVLELEHTGPTPSEAEVRKLLSKNLKHNEKLIVLKHIYPKFGEHKVDIIAYAYNDEKSMKNLENIKEEVKEDGKEKSKKQETK